MKKYLLSLVCLSILTSCSGGTSTSIDSSQGFRVTPPASYTAGTDTKDGIALREKESGTIIVAKKFPITADYQKSDDSITEFYKKNAPLDTNGSVKFGTKDGGSVQWTNKLGSLSFIHKDAWTIDGDSLYTVSCTIQERSKEKGLSDCESVVASFQIK